MATNKNQIEINLHDFARCSGMGIPVHRTDAHDCHRQNKLLQNKINEMKQMEKKRMRELHELQHRCDQLEDELQLQARDFRKEIAKYQEQRDTERAEVQKLQKSLCAADEQNRRLATHALLDALNADKIEKETKVDPVCCNRLQDVVSELRHKMEIVELERKQDYREAVHQAQLQRLMLQQGRDNVMVEQSALQPRSDDSQSTIREDSRRTSHRMHHPTPLSIKTSNPLHPMRRHTMQPIRPPVGDISNCPFACSTKRPPHVSIQELRTQKKIRNRFVPWSPLTYQRTRDKAPHQSGWRFLPS